MHCDFGRNLFLPAKTVEIHLVSAEVSRLVCKLVPSMIKLQMSYYMSWTTREGLSLSASCLLPCPHRPFVLFCTLPNPRYPVTYTILSPRDLYLPNLEIEMFKSKTSHPKQINCTCILDQIVDFVLLLYEGALLSTSLICSASYFCSSAGNGIF